MPGKIVRAGILWLALSCLGTSAGAAAANPDGCFTASVATPVMQGKRAVEPNDLIQLRDIGPNWTTDPSTQLLAVSPDGTAVAFQLRQASVTGNDYCFGMYVLPLGASGKPILVNQGGEYIKVVLSVLGFAAHTSPGVARVVSPKWSPDGKWIAFLRRDHGITQVWRAKADGTFSEALTNFAFDVEDFVWSSDGARIVLSGRPGLLATESSIADEGRGGFLYDERFKPVSTVNQPFPREPIETNQFSIGIIDRQVRAADDEEKALLSQSDASPSVGAIVKPSPRPGGSKAWIGRENSSDLSEPVLLNVILPNGEQKTCSDPSCQNVLDFLWSADGSSIFFLTRDGWGGSQLSLFEWALGVAPPRKIKTTDDVLMGCQAAAQTLVCAEEGSEVPRRLVRVDPLSGEVTLLFDPNPEFATLNLGGVHRLKWTNDVGIQGFGDLVTPPGYDGHTLLPLVVVQYESRGFLRGGTGDDFPIQVFAAHGYAVLSVQNPVGIGHFEGGKTQTEVGRLDRLNWANRRSVLSSLETGVRLVVAMGTADPKKVGLTGLSDGASTVQFALVNSKMFAAASMGSCCEEPSVVNFLDGEVGEAWLGKMGYPSILSDGKAFWSDMSLRANASKIKTPVLMQLPDREYLGALESYMALKEARAPVEMFVFPDEYHVKWQPQHRLASYERTLDWFDFWLKGERACDSAKAVQHIRWNSLEGDTNQTSRASPGK